MRVVVIAVFLFNLLFGVGIATGGKTGTYYPFGKDIVRACNLNMDVYNTKGSLENYKRLLADPKVKFVIMQYDVLQYFKKLGNPNVNKIKMIIPLYDEELHIIVRKDAYIENLDDLEDKKVAIGKRGSGTWLTSKLIEKVTNIKFSEEEIGIVEGLKQLKQNKIDAVITVAGAPTSLLSAFPERASQYFRLLSIDNSNLNKIYTHKIIQANTYKWEDKNINTYGVKSILATFDYKPYQPSYKRVQALYACLKRKISYLKEYGHPKWKEVDIDSFSDVNWPIHSAVLNYNKSHNLANSRSIGNGSSNSLKDEVNSILNGF
jgi:TRAP transporter TAXI family solute receptor